MNAPLMPVLNRATSFRIYLALMKPSCTTCYVSFDHLGSVRMLTDGNGNVVARQDYLPFGEEIPAGYAGRSSSLLFGASDGVEQKFTGQVRDSETGMDFFPKRYYASAVGRFTSPDPMNLGADLLDPQSWNAYAYVRNNPLALVDPMGGYATWAQITLHMMTNRVIAVAAA